MAFPYLLDIGVCESLFLSFDSTSVYIFRQEVAYPAVRIQASIATKP